MLLTAEKQSLDREGTSQMIRERSFQRINTESELMKVGHRQGSEGTLPPEEISKWPNVEQAQQVSQIRAQLKHHHGNVITGLYNNFAIRPQTI